MIIGTSQPEWHGPPVTTTPVYIAWLISAVPSRMLTNITLEFKGSITHLQYQLAMPEWDTVEDVLVNHPTVKSVEIIWEKSWNMNGIREAMCNFFPNLYSSGKLRFRS